MTALSASDLHAIYREGKPDGSGEAWFGFESVLV